MNKRPTLTLPPFAAPTLRDATRGFSEQLELAGRNVVVARRPGRPQAPVTPLPVRYVVQPLPGAERTTLIVAAGSQKGLSPRWAWGMRFPLLTLSIAGDGDALRLRGRFPLPGGDYVRDCPARREDLDRLLAETFAALLRRPLPELARP